VGVVVAGCLVVSAWGSATVSIAGVVVFGAGIAIAAVAGVAFLRRGDPRSWRRLLAFALLCATYFGVYELLALTVVEGLGAPLLWAAVAVAGGLVAWSVTGLRPRPEARLDFAIVGPVIVTAALGILMVGLGVGLVVAGAVMTGAGMGLAYPLLSAEPFSCGTPATTVGALIAFAETAGTAWAVLLAGGLYSALHNAGWAPTPSLEAVFVLLACVGAAAIVAAVRRGGRVIARAAS